MTMDFLHPFSSTFVVLFWSRDIIHLLTDDDSHFRFRAFSIDLNATLSKAPSTSKNVPRAIPELMIVRSILCTILCRAVSVEAPFTNPYCFLLSFEYILRSTSLCHNTIRSIHLSGTGARVMVL